MALATVQAIFDGYESMWSKTAAAMSVRLLDQNSMQRAIQAGAKPVLSLSVMLEWQRDWAYKDTYAAVMDIVKNHFGPMHGC